MQTIIEFESKNVELPSLDFEKLRRWLIDVARLHNKKVGRINYLFCDDAEILIVNRQFLDHDFFTDIITFDYSHKDMVSGDIVISLDTVKDNADKYSATYNSEILRVIVHGLLHLCGINDKGPGEREIMENNENMALSLWDSMGSCA